MATPAVDIQILDDGTGLCTVSFLDAKGNGIPQPSGSTVAFTSSDTVNAPVDPTSGVITPAGPLATGVTITATATLADGTTTFSDSKLVDVVSDPSKPGGISLAVAEQ